MQTAGAAAFGRSPLATAITEGPRHVLRYLNPAWLESHYAADDPGLGRPFAERYPELAAVDPVLLDRVFRTGQGAQAGPPISPSRSEKREFVIAAWPWGSAHSDRLVIQLLELTSQTQKHSQLNELARELMKVNERLLLSGIRDKEIANRSEELRAGAEQRNKAKSSFISGVSHELRTPLNALIGYVELMIEGVAGPVTQQQTHMLGRVKASSLHLLEVVEQVLTFSRFEAGQMLTRMESVDAIELAREAAALVAPMLQKNEISFQLQVPDAPVVLETDPGLLKQILINLLSNAAKFTDAGRIRLEIKEDDKDLICVVHDTGIGIAPDQLERIFEPFKQVEQDAARASGGSGLGLTVSRQIARRLGGDLTVQSTQGVGSTFILRIPRQLGSTHQEAAD